MKVFLMASPKEVLAACRPLDASLSSNLNQHCNGMRVRVRVQIDKCFGFDTAVEEAQTALLAAKVEAISADQGIGLVKLMGRSSGFIAMQASMASGHPHIFFPLFILLLLLLLTVCLIFVIFLSDICQAVKGLLLGLQGNCCPCCASACSSSSEFPASLLICIRGYPQQHHCHASLS